MSMDFCGSETQAGLAGFSAESHKAEIQVSVIWASIGRLWGEICFHTRSGRWQSCWWQFLVAVELRSLFPRCLLSGVILKLLRLPSFSGSRPTSSSFKISGGGSCPSYALNLPEFPFYFVSPALLFCCISSNNCSSFLFWF